MNRRAALGASLALGALASHHMRSALFLGGVYFERDVHLTWHAQMENFVHAVAQGSLPLWDPWIGFGQPMLANPNNQLLYPLTWLNLLIVPSSYYKLYLFLHLMLGGVGAMRLASRLGTGPLASFTSGALFLLSGPFLSLANAWNHVAGAGLLPWLVVASDRLAERPDPRRGVILAAVVSLMVLAGSPDSVLLGLPLALSIALWRLHRGSARWAPLLIQTGLAFCLSLGLTAVQVLPALELARRTARAALTEQERDHWSLHPLAGLQAFVPVDHAPSSLPLEWRGVLFEGREPYLFSIYMGVPTLLLAAVGLARRSDSPRGWLLVPGLLLGLTALGRHAPVHGWFVALFPPLGLVRFPVKALTVVSLVLALAAGWGVEALAARGAARRAAALLGLGWAGICAGARWLVAPPFVFLSGPLLHSAGCAAVFSLWLLPRAGPRLGSLGLVLLAVCDLALTHSNLNPTAPADFYRARPALLAEVRPDDFGRWHVLDYTSRPDWSQRWLGRPRPFVVAVRPGSPEIPYWQGAMGIRLYPVAPLLSSWRQFGSYSRDLLGLLPTIQVQLNDALVHSFPGSDFERLLQIGGVTHFAALHEIPAPSLHLERRLPGPFFEDIRLYRVEGSVPRAYIATASARTSLLDPAFEPGREALVEGVAGSERGGESSAGAASIVEYRADRVRVDCQVAVAGSYLVLVDNWDPGWRAEVDGQSTSVLRANGAFRAVALPPGRHLVSLRYRPPVVGWGLLASASSLAMAVFLWSRSGGAFRA